MKSGGEAFGLDKCPQSGYLVGYITSVVRKVHREVPQLRPGMI